MRVKRHIFGAGVLAAAVLFGGAAVSAGPVKPRAQVAKSVYIRSPVIDLATGRSFDLATLANVKKPTLMFMWAPS